jgi:hypothetical protein
VVKRVYFVNMGPTEPTLIRDIQLRLAELLALSPRQIEVEAGPRPASDVPFDRIVRAAGFRFAMEYRSRGDAAEMGAAVRLAQRAGVGSRAKAIPLVVAPFIGDVGRKICEEEGVCWLDLSGNAHLVAPGLRVNIQGQPNKFIRPGRPRSLFAPKSSRIARWMLIEPDRVFTQRALAKAADLDEGFTSRIVRHMQRQDLVVRLAGGGVKVRDPQTLLDAWSEAYDFARHRIVRGHVAARSGDEVLHRLSSGLRHDGLRHAATGLAGAWLLNPFAGFRLVTLYVAHIPSVETQEAMGFRAEPHGENVWLVVPNDPGVFDGAVERDGFWCAHPVQVFLDLNGHPERSAEAAASLRQTLFSKVSRAR